MDPVNIPTLDTLRFVTRWIKKPSRILEIGCGNGEVAAALSSRGHQLVAIDSDEAAIANARQLGIDARLARWPQFVDQPFDAILFTRSLHHIHPLGEALEAAGRLLAPGGAIIVEEVANEALTPATASWFQPLLQMLAACDMLVLEEDDLYTALLAARQGRQPQREQHLHSAAVLQEALGARFRLAHRETAPYLYRYICQRVPPNAQGAAVVTAALELERSLGAIDSDCWIGRRFVANRQP